MSLGHENLFKQANHQRPRMTTDDQANVRMLGEFDIRSGRKIKVDDFSR